MRSWRRRLTARATDEEGKEIAGALERQRRVLGGQRKLRD